MKCIQKRRKKNGPNLHTPPHPTPTPPSRPPAAPGIPNRKISREI